MQRGTKTLPYADATEKTAKLVLPCNNSDNYADKIKSYRKNHNLTQKELAEMMGINHLTLRSWEQGKAKPPHNTWRRFRNLFDNSIDFP